MNSTRSEFLAAWIIAIALIAAMGLHAFLPRPAPRLGLGVTEASQPRASVVSRDGHARPVDADLPLREGVGVERPEPDNSGPGL